MAPSGAIEYVRVMADNPALISSSRVAVFPSEVAQERVPSEHATTDEPETVLCFGSTSCYGFSENAMVFKFILFRFCSSLTSVILD